MSLNSHNPRKNWGWQHGFLTPALRGRDEQMGRSLELTDCLSGLMSSRFSEGSCLKNQNEAGELTQHLEPPLL